MPDQRNSGCEGMPDDKLEKLRARFRERGESTPRAGLESGSQEQHAERLRAEQADAIARNRSGEYRKRG